MNDAEEVAAGERAIAAAHLSLDIAVLEHLYHRDFVNVAADGTVDGKAEMIASWRAGDRHWEIAQSEDLDVRVTAETAVVTGRWRSRGTNRGIPFDYAARFLSVWVREAGQWRNLAYQDVEMRAPPTSPR